jgi:hypothetical protein
MGLGEKSSEPDALSTIGRAGAGRRASAEGKAETEKRLESAKGPVE